MEAFEKIMMSYKCPKTLDSLQPCESNWYCNGCQQMVHDFRGLTEAEILNTFKQSGKKLCGIYETERLRVTLPQSHWQKWASAAMIALGISTVGCATNGQNTPSGKTIAQHQDSFVLHHTVGMVIIEEPKFPAGDEGFQRYLHSVINYTGTYRGDVFVDFTVQKDGSLSNISLRQKTAHPSLDAKILNAFKHSPKWNPVMRSGKAVISQYWVKVDFSKK